MAANTCFISFILLLANIIVVSQANRCAYTLYVQTGKMEYAGTDSLISLTLSDQNQKQIYFPDLEQWGDMDDPEYDYFERANLDSFSGIAPCLQSPVCSITLTSDGTGKHPGWYVNYLNITASGPDTDYERHFKVNRWLAVDEPTYNLTVTVDKCPSISMLHDERVKESVINKK